MLRYEFANDNREVSDRCHDGDQGDGVRGRRGYAPRLQTAGELLGNRRAAEGAGEHTNQGDADLHRREKPAGILQERKCGRCTAAAGLGKCPKTRPPG